MKDNREKIIKDTSEVMTRDSILTFPQNIAILINSKTASAAELFIIASKQSKKVKTIWHQQFWHSRFWMANNLYYL